MNDSIRRSIPTTISAASMFLGLWAVVLASRGRVEPAAWMIIYCGFLDKLDGIVARFFGVSSAFGMEMDSFSDFTAFGVAPGLLAWFAWSGEPGISAVWLAFAAASFPFFAAVRLARFNLVTHADPDWFTGVPTTFVALLFASLFLAVRDLGLARTGDLFALAVMPGLAVLMVTSIRIPKLKPRRSRGFNWFQVATALVVLAVSLAQVFPELPLAVGVGYLGLGWLVGRRTAPREWTGPNTSVGRIEVGGGP